MYEFTFLRHGESEGVQKKILQGHLDLPLTLKGKEQIQKLARFWQTRQQSFDRILSSPLRRARETSEMIAAYLNIAHIEEKPDWIERNFGEGEGADLKVIEDWYKSRPLPTPFEPIYETGETEWQVHLRAGRAVDELLKLPEGNYLVVSHGNVINAALHMIFGILPSGRAHPVVLGLEPACFAKVAYDPLMGRWKMINFNVDLAQ